MPQEVEKGVPHEVEKGMPQEVEKGLLQEEADVTPWVQLVLAPQKGSELAPPCNIEHPFPS